MSEVLAVIEGTPTEPLVMNVASAMGEVMHAHVRSVCLERGSDQQHQADFVLGVLTEPAIGIGVLAAQRSMQAVCWRVVSQSSKPIVLIPPDTPLARPAIGRALLPLDGTEESARAVSKSIDLLARAGVDLVVVHVFDVDSAPMFWDQAAYASADWATEFLSRHVEVPNARLELRSGSPGEQVVDVARAENADLIALGWSQQLEGERARTVRRCVFGSRVPVLLVPLSSRRPSDHRPGGRSSDRTAATTSGTAPATAGDKPTPNPRSAASTA